MEKWKMGVIALLILSFGGFAALQNGAANKATSASSSTETSSVTAQPTPSAVSKLVGTHPVTWNFDQSQWVNTPRPMTPADLKGKVTLLEFWRMSCSHCQEAVPFMNELQKRYVPRGLQIISFQSPGLLPDPLNPAAEPNPENNWQTVQKWIKEQDIKYPVAFDVGRKVKNETGVEYYPLMMLVDGKGIIRYAATGHTPEKAQALVQSIETELAKAQIK